MGRAAKRAVLAAAALNFVAVSAFHRGWIRPLVDGAAPPDSLPFGYSPETFRAWADGLGEAGRGLYLLGSTLSLDLSFPVLLAAASVILLRGAAGADAGRAVRALSVAVPLAAMAFDLAENAIVGLMLAGTLDGTDGAIGLASAATMAKYGAHALAILLLLVLLAARAGETKP